MPVEIQFVFYDCKYALKKKQKKNVLLYETIICRGVLELLYDSLEIKKFHYGLVLQMCIGSSTDMVF